MQEAVPVLLDLGKELQAGTSDCQFSSQYICQLLGEVQSVLASNGMDTAAKQAEKLLQASSQGTDALTFQQLVQETVMSKEVCARCAALRLQ